MMGIYAKLITIQCALCAPRNKHNEFGNFNYRSCEDILQAVKPLCKANGVSIILNDEMVLVGERYYVKASATMVDIESSEQITTVAYARETESRPKYDASQLTGCASSYARKYALAGLLNIDNNKDADECPPDDANEQAEAKASGKTAKTQEQVPVYALDSIVKKHDGKDLIRYNNQWFYLEQIPIEGLNTLLNEPAYAQAYEIINSYMNKAYAKQS